MVKKVAELMNLMIYTVPSVVYIYHFGDDWRPIPEPLYMKRKQRRVSDKVRRAPMGKIVCGESHAEVVDSQPQKSAKAPRWVDIRHLNGEAAHSNMADHENPMPGLPNAMSEIS